MGGLRDIKKRIRSVKSSQKITKAMMLVAASKLRRAQEAIVAARPYADALGDLVGRLTGPAEADLALSSHPLMVQREQTLRTVLVVVSSDRGSCGAFNANVFRRAERLMRENEGQFGAIEVLALGKKAREYFAKRPDTRLHPLQVTSFVADVAGAQLVAEKLAHSFSAKQADAVLLVYNRFKSAMVQQVMVEPLLPVAQVAGHSDSGVAQVSEPLYAPSRAQLLADVVPRLVASQIWRALLESAAAEQAARMTAMDAATNNARDLAESYTLQYNRARQAAITLELMDIVGGAEALAG